MTPKIAVVILVMIAVMGIVVWGLISTRRSAIVGVMAAAVALLSAAGGWHAWAETRSLPWTAAYGAIAIASLVCAARQFASRGYNLPPSR